MKQSYSLFKWKVKYLQHESESTWGGCHWEDRRPPEPKGLPHSGHSLSGQPSRAQNGLQHPAYLHKLLSPSVHAVPASDPYQPAQAKKFVTIYDWSDRIKMLQWATLTARCSGLTGILLSMSPSALKDISRSLNRTKILLGFHKFYGHIKNNVICSIWSTYQLQVLFVTMVSCIVNSTVTL